MAIEFPRSEGYRGQSVLGTHLRQYRAEYICGRRPRRPQVHSRYRIPRYRVQTRWTRIGYNRERTSEIQALGGIENKDPWLYLTPALEWRSTVRDSAT